MNERVRQLRKDLGDIIFEADTPAAKGFDIFLMVAICLSVFALMLESIPEVQAEHRSMLRTVEWTLTGLFTLEYVLRLLTATHPARYARSFFGVVDLLSIVPTYLSLVIGGTHVLTVVRALRLLRIFRILKLVRFVREARTLGAALAASLRKIVVFMGFIVTMIVILGAVMYLVEGENFSSIPRAMYWAVVTMTTVGYGDVVPATPLGKFVASIVMLLGYGVIAVPTGIVSAEMVSAQMSGAREKEARTCSSCGGTGHDRDARYCKHCSKELDPET